MGGKNLNFYVGPQAPITNKSTSEEEKTFGKAHSRWTNREMFNSISPRESSSSDLTNVSKVNFVLTWITFQEVPAMKIDSRCTRKG